MPDLDHELPLLLLRENPRALRALVQAMAPETRLDESAPVEFLSEGFTQIAPTEYRADAVARLGSPPTVAVVIEVQRRKDARKPYVWTLYRAAMFAREEIPVELFVITPSRAVARWASSSISLGLSDQWTPHVLGPNWLERVHNPDLLERFPDLSVLALHLSEGEDAGTPDLATFAAKWLATNNQLAEDTARLYRDIVRHAVRGATRQIVESIMSVEHTGYESQTFREVFGEGREEGREIGEKETLRRMLRRILQKRFGALDHDTHEQITSCESAETLERWFDQALNADHLRSVFE